MDLLNLTVGITGGNSGIGLAIVKLLLNVCKKIIIVDDSDICEQLKDIPNVKYFQSDLNNLEVGPFEVDVFIHNVGLSIGPKTAHEPSYEEMKEIIKRNFMLPSYLTININSRKHVYIASILSYIGLDRYSLYCSSKEVIRDIVKQLEDQGHDTMVVFPYKMNSSVFNEVEDFNAIDVEYMAKEVLEGIKKDKKEIVLPRKYVLVDVLERVIPRVVMNFVLDKIATYFVKKDAIEESPSVKNLPISTSD
ncbi:short-chain dehydrogenase/reductase [Vairimorpha necatrix]|uniref:Short-chain dehydrogenase/reductase n=1 Tax=Vairimorpha necatrix TaxID=6039 RepID=A0AAX4JDU1_9MICR